MSDVENNTAYPYVMSEDITALDCDDAIHLQLHEIEATCFELAKNEQSSQSILFHMRAHSHFLGQSTANARGEFAMFFSIFHRPAL